MCPDTMGIEADKGDIVFFPSHMIHGVSPHKSDNPRITVSGNITIQDLRTEIERLKEQGMQGLVIDLRNNGGGALKTVVDMAGMLNCLSHFLYKILLENILDWMVYPNLY